MSACCRAGIAHQHGLLRDVVRQPPGHVPLRLYEGEVFPNAARPALVALRPAHPELDQNGQAAVMGIVDHAATCIAPFSEALDGAAVEDGLDRLRLNFDRLVTVDDASRSKVR